jgi:anti-sigma regulatory factor (Ser/Thr protein kinase)
MPVDEAAARGHVRLLLSPDVDAPAEARRALRALPLGDRAVDAMLLTSELVTNAVVHGGLDTDAAIELDAACLPGGAMRIAVRDRGCGFEPGDVAQGLGLQMMDAVTREWGLSRDGGTCVWFELR